MHRAINIVLEIPCRETDWNISILVFMFKFSTYCSQSASYNQERNPSSTYAYSAFSTITTEICVLVCLGFSFVKEDIAISSRGEGGRRYTLAAILEGIHSITSDMCVGIHISLWQGSKYWPSRFYPILHVEFGLFFVVAPPRASFVKLADWVMMASLAKCLFAQNWGRTFRRWKSGHS